MDCFVRSLALGAVVFCAGCLATSDIGRDRAHELVRQGARLVDVRSPSEFAERHPEGAINIPLEVLKKRMRELQPSATVIVYCHTGVRAAIAARWLRQAGYSAVHNLGTLGHWYFEGTGPAPSFE